MNRILASLFFAISTLAPGAHGLALGAPYVSYPDFALMDREGRHDVVRMAQDYTVELEQQSRYYILRANAKSRRTSFIDLLIKSAHAAIQGHNEPCVYAGWPSVMEEIAGRLYCNNPGKHWSYLPRYQENGQDPEYLKNLEISKQVYQQAARAKDFRMISYDVKDDALNIIFDEEGATCESAKGASICNPIIFGQDGDTPFCVAANADHRGYNASFLCERALNKIRKEEPARYEGIMDGIVARAMDEKTRPLFLNAMRDMYDMCMCSQDEDGEGGFRNGRVVKVYADQMFYTRTCAGIIYQSKMILDRVNTQPANACVIFSPVGDDNKDWFKFAREATKNFETETKNLSRDEFITYLEIKDTDAQKAEQEYIHNKRNQARDMRGGHFCPIEIEAPEPPQSEPTKPHEGPRCEIKLAVADKKVTATLKLLDPSLSFDKLSFSEGAQFQLKEESYVALIELPEEAQEDFSVSASEGDEKVCSESIAVEPPAEDPASSQCSIELAQDKRDTGVVVSATVKIDGKEHPKGSGGTLTFRQPPTPVENNTADELVPSADATANRGPATKLGNPIKSEESEDAYAALIEPGEKSQMVHAYFDLEKDGKKISCEASTEVAKAPEQAPERRQRRMFAPQTPQPNLIQKRQGRGGFFLRGNR